MLQSEQNYYKHQLLSYFVQLKKFKTILETTKIYVIYVFFLIFCSEHNHY